MNYYPTKRTDESLGQSEGERLRIAFLGDASAFQKAIPPRTPVRPLRVPTVVPKPQPMLIEPLPVVRRFALSVVRRHLLGQVATWVATQFGEPAWEPGEWDGPIDQPGLSRHYYGMEAICTTVPGNIISGLTSVYCGPQESLPDRPAPETDFYYTPSNNTTHRYWDYYVGSDGHPAPYPYRYHHRIRYYYRQAGNHVTAEPPLKPAPWKPQLTTVRRYGHLTPFPQRSRVGQAGHGRLPPPVRTGTRAKRPGKGRKEVKAALTIRGTIVDQIMGTVTESLDLLNCAHSALPFRLQAKGRYDPTRYGGQGGWRRYTPQQQAHVLYTHWDKIDVGAFIQCVIENQVEDYLIGRLGQLTAKANRRRGYFAGLQFGPAL